MSIINIFNKTIVFIFVTTYLNTKSINVVCQGNDNLDIQSTVRPNDTDADLYLKDDCWKNLRVIDTTHNSLYRNWIPPKESGAVRMFISTWSSETTDKGTRPGVHEVNSAAYTMAFYDFCKQNEGIKKQKFDLIFLDSRCKVSIGIANTEVMMKQGADVILGVPCSNIFQHGAFYLAHHNIAALSYGANSAEMDIKEEFNTFVRFGYGYKSTGKAFMEIFKSFNWRSISMLSTSSYCPVSDYIFEAAKAEPNITIVENTRAIYTLTDTIRLDLLRRFRERSRVLVLCMTGLETSLFLELAYTEGMTTPEYVYLTSSRDVTEYTLKPWADKLDVLEPAEAKFKKDNIYSRIKSVTRPLFNTPQILEFMDKVEIKSREYPWYLNNTEQHYYTTLAYDIMWFYLDYVNETFTTGEDPGDGRRIFQRAANLVSKGVSGEITMDPEADRIPNYLLWHYIPGEMQFTQFASLRMINNEGERVLYTTDAYWGTADGLPPLNEPVCGFRDELCPQSTKGRDAALIAGFTCLAVVIVTVFAGYIVYKKKKFEDDLQKMSWKILFDDIKFSNKKAGGSSIGMSLKSLKSSTGGSFNKISTTSAASLASVAGHHEQIFTKIGTYKGMVCAVKTIEKTDCKVTRAELIELKQVKELSHENVNSFIGACINPPLIYILTNYCAKGSLQDILEHDEIKLDWMFKCSLIFDLINGLHYIHTSPIHSHGHMRSSDCLIDGRWVLKIGNVGQVSIKKKNVVKKEAGEYKTFRDYLWSAPELLRMQESELPPNGTQKGDIYSFAIILQEIIFRALPYFMDSGSLSPKEIVQQIRKIYDPSYRPEIPSHEGNSDTDPRMIHLMTDCWEEIPSFRPDTNTIMKKLATLNKGKKVNMLDNMVQKLERYANNLEDIVEKRTEELVTEKKKTDLLLYRMLPSVVAEKLKHGQMVQPEIYEDVSIYFSDVVGFTSISSESTPIQVVDLLNDLYTLFDDIIEKHDVYKVETIGDAYMCVSGCPNKNGNKHAAEIANMSLELRSNVKKFTIRHMPETSLRIRIGLHSGSCAAGVVGLTMPRYCLFGDTVNVASRMESNGEAMKIHISPTTFEILSEQPNTYELKLRGQVDLKGKGLVTTYWLDERGQESEC